MSSTPLTPFEQQQQELEVLQSIYGPSDFINDPLPAQPRAWGKSTGIKGGEFGIRVSGIHQGVEDKSQRSVSVVLVIKYSKSYPKTPPTLSLTSPINTSPGQLATLTKLVNQEAHRLSGGGVIVYELIDFVQEWLSTNVHPPPSADSDRQSLLVEMAKREAEDKAARLQHTQLEKSNLAQQAHQRALSLAQKVTEHKRLQSSRQAELAAAAAASSLGGDLSSADNLTEITFSSSSSTSSNIIEGGGSIGMEGTFRLLGGVREKLWTTYLAIPIPPNNYNRDHSSSSSSLVDLASPSFYSTHQPLSVTLVDFPTPYYSSTQGSQKLGALAATMRKKLLNFRGEGVVPILSVMLVDLPGKGGKRLGLLTGRVGRGERLRGVLKVCGRLEMGVAKDHLIQLLAGLEAMRKEGITHDDVCLDTVVLSSSSGGARLAEPCYRKRIIDLDRSNPFLQSGDVYADGGGAGEDGDEKEVESLPWNWLSPDEIEAGHTFTHKRDIWHSGVTFLRMLWGADVIYRYPDLEAILVSDDFFVPETLAETLRRMFEPNPKERWSAEQIINTLSTLDLAPRGNLSLGINDLSGRMVPSARPSRSPLAGPLHPFFDRKGGNPNLQMQMTSRYRTDFEEVEFLGEGGFGKVVKAKNRLDGRFYAIKKIKLRPEDNEQKVFREVNALSRLNHQFIVRYFTCWLEETVSPPLPPLPPHPHTPTTAHTSAASTPNMSSSTSSLQESSSAISKSPNPGSTSFDEAMFETNFDDFLSVRGHQSRSTSFPSIHFGGDEDEESDEDSDGEGDEEGDGEDESTEEEASRSKKRSLAALALSSKKGSGLGGGLSGALSPSGTETSGGSTMVWGSRVLYIQMEYVENQTLKEAIARGLSEEESWRLFRQILEALRHMTELGIVHRDLKPSNLLIDHENRIKIGDFGLAATDFAPSNETLMIENTPLKQLADAADLTSGIGTSLYIAPEVEMSGKIRGNAYDGKADLYSLGIIFFEMCFPLATGMERAFVIRELRNPSVNFPPSWNKAAMPQQTKIIDLLLQHNPAKRPRVVDLLSSGLLPSVKEDEYFLEALRTFGNPNSSRYPLLISHIFAQTPEAVSDFTFDDPDASPKEHRVYEALVKDRLVDLFRRHGAIDWEPPPLLPVTELLTEFRKEAGARFLNRQGQLVELPYDGLVSFARHIARTKRERLKRYHFGSSYRESLMGGQPLSFGEVAYDILSPVRSMASEAEIISVLDKILDSFPGLHKRHEWEFHISHQAVLDLVLSEVPSRRRAEIADVLREIGGRVGFPQVRSKLNLPRQVADRLEKWCLSEPLDLAMERLLHKFPQLSSSLQKAVKEIREVSLLAEKLGVRRRIIFRPTMSHRFFKGGVMFECVRKSNKREVLGVGGRYDNLIEHFRLPQTNTSLAPTSHVAGCQISLERIAFLVGKYESSEGKRLINLDSELDRSFGWTPRRCDVYVGSFGEGWMEDRVEIVGELWGAGLRADLMYEDAVRFSAEEAMAECLAQGILFLVISKGRPLLKVRSVLRRTEDEVYREDLLTYLRTHIADQRRIDLTAASTPPHSHLDRESLLKPINNRDVPTEQIKLILPGEKGVGKEVKGARKLHRHGTKALFWEKARQFLSVVRSPLPLFALDVPSPVLSAMVLDTTWLLLPTSSAQTGELDSHSTAAAEAWKAIREKYPLGQPGYASSVRDELREFWESEVLEGGGGAVWLFSVREEKGFLLQWPTGKH